MEHVHRRSWWVYLVQGLLTVVFGVVAIAWPSITLFSFILLFGAYAVLNGFVRVAAALTNLRELGWWDLLTNILAGIASVAAGVVAFAWPELTGLLLLFVIGAYAMFTGLMVVLSTIGYLFTGRDRLWDMLLALLRGTVGIVFGILAFALPGVTALSLAWLIGLYAILFGVSEMGFAFVARRTQSEVDPS